jgi:hypothetical protein
MRRGNIKRAEGLVLWKRPAWMDGKFKRSYMAGSRTCIQGDTTHTKQYRANFSGEMI